MANFLTILTVCSFFLRSDGLDYRFSTYYNYLWGAEHFSLNPQETEVQLTIDQKYGAGFRSKQDYGSGLFHIKMKIPEKKTGGIVPNFYLTSAPDNNQDPGNHFEIDFEFLGTNGTVQTNVYNDDTGHREQSFNLWFNPSKDFHTYEFLWNPSHIVFIIDGIPIREFKNLKGKGIAYPDKPMHVEASIWNANWAGSVNWENAPFIAHYSDFGFNACPANPSTFAGCGSKGYFWNKPAFSQLSPAQRAQMAAYRKKYMIYDYCWKPSTSKPECSFNV